MTQTIQNDSAVDLTVQSVKVDNNATLVPGGPTVIRAATSGTFKATNSGNGIQMWVTLSGAGGQMVVVDTDVPRNNPNSSQASISGTINGISAGAISVSDHDEPNASFTLESCAIPADCMTTAPSDPTPP